MHVLIKEKQHNKFLFDEHLWKRRDERMFTVSVRTKYSTPEWYRSHSNKFLQNFDYRTTSSPLFVWFAPQVPPRLLLFSHISLCDRVFTNSLKVFYKKNNSYTERIPRSYKNVHVFGIRSHPFYVNHKKCCARTHKLILE